MINGPLWKCAPVEGVWAQLLCLSVHAFGRKPPGTDESSPDRPEQKPRAVPPAGLALCSPASPFTPASLSSRPAVQGCRELVREILSKENFQDTTNEKAELRRQEEDRGTREGQTGSAEDVLIPESLWVTQNPRPRLSEPAARPAPP